MAAEITPAVLESDLGSAISLLKAKHKRLSRYYDYYDGDHDALYLTRKMRAAYKRIDVHFSENWCAPVIDLLLDRLELNAVTAKGAGDAKLQGIWEREELAIESKDLSADIAITGQGFLIVDRAEDSDSTAKIFRNDPRNCTAAFSSRDPRSLRMAAKWWDDEEDQRKHVMLYYADWFIHYRATKSAKNLRKAGDFELYEDPQDNPDSIIPVFLFTQRTRKPCGELHPALPVQIAINRLAEDMMTASEYSAFKQRWAIANADPADLERSPGTTQVFPPANKVPGEEEQDVSVGEFSATELQNYIGAIEHKANAMSSITRTPKPAFFATEANTSGDALIAQDAQLASKARAYRRRETGPWRKALSLALEIEGAKTAPKDITPVWDEARISQPVAEAQTVSALVLAGMPLTTALKESMGWTDDQVKKMLADKVAEEQAGATEADLALAAARKLNQGG